MIEITTYNELSEFVAAFADDHVNMLVLCSRGGLGKTEETRRRLNDHEIVHIPGHVTPLELYRLLYQGQGQNVVFDEIDGLLSNAKHIGLLKQLGATQAVKTISWQSTDKRAQDIDGGRGHFHTSSRFLILCNSFAALNDNVAALQTRATVVHFAPDSLQILEKVKTFATDDEIIRFLEEMHECLPDFNLRTYLLFKELKNAGLDWRKYALGESGIPAKVVELANLLARYNSDKERLRGYSGSRRDYYNWKPQASVYLQRQQLRRIAGYAQPDQFV